MSQLKQDEEIDFFELVESLWTGKWIIIALTCISMAISFSFTSYKKKQMPSPYFLVSAPYFINLFSPFDHQICNRDTQCINNRVSNKLKKMAQESWSNNEIIQKEWKTAGADLKASKPKCSMEFCLELITRLPQDREVYYEQLQKFNQTLTSELEQEIQNEILVISQLIKNFKNQPALVSQPFAKNNLELQRYLSVIEDGQMIVNFEQIDIRKVYFPNKHNHLLVVSFVLGGFLGCCLVLLRSAISRRQDITE